MRNLLVIYNVIFLLIGNLLFSHIHHLDEHNNGTHEDFECYECINLNNSTNYYISYNNLILLQVEYIQFVSYEQVFIRPTNSNINLSRAPPLS